MNKKIIIFLLVLAVMIAGFTAFYIVDKHIPMDSANVGNTSGNLQNNGLFFEMDGKVYFANASDNNCLYSMNVDESHPKSLTSMGVKYISGADGFLYFYMDSTHKSSSVSGLGSATNQFGIYRCRANGSDQVCITRDFCGELQLCGEYLYYQVTTDGGSLKKIKCNKKDQQLVSDELISPVCYDNGIIYYSGVTNDHNIHAMYTSSGDMSTDVLKGYCFFPEILGDFIYYLNGDMDYSLWRVNLISGEQQQITTERVDCFNVSGSEIFYSCSAVGTPALYRCDLNGGNKTILYQGIVNSINVTSQYLYFKLYGDDSVIYHMPLNGSAAASPFIVTSK